MMRVIGAGFGRTGTLSRKVALEELGCGPCYHMIEVFDKPRPCLVTVDDGFASSTRLGLEVFSDFGITALFFVCPGLVDAPLERQQHLERTNMFRGAPPTDFSRLMNWDEIAALQAAGHVIGAHGMSHRRLSDLSSTELEDEVGAASQALAGRSKITGVEGCEALANP